MDLNCRFDDADSSELVYMRGKNFERISQQFRKSVFSQFSEHPEKRVCLAPPFKNAQETKALRETSFGFKLLNFERALSVCQIRAVVTERESNSSQTLRILVKAMLNKSPR